MKSYSKITIILLAAALSVWLLTTWAGILGNIEPLEHNKQLILLVFGYILWDLYGRIRN